MSAVLRDLWPADLVAEDVLGPEEILDEQAQLLTRRMNDLLQGKVVRTVTDDRVVLGFEVFAPRLDQTKRLFSVQHRLELEYPAVFVTPSEEIPRYLREQVLIPGRPETKSIRVPLGCKSTFEFSNEPEVVVIPATKPRIEENEWVAGTPNEFIEKLGKVLSSPTVKSVIVSLLAKSQRSSDKPHSSNGTA